ncbi:hypothetical protein [Lactococcus cremoris]|uniref:hypothetical protein n=1 Tax=Lactococcus lactis subsp. cremoris TaxID=1359 RepID=UPI00223BF8BA|nr:hypothetical protein [Lactococcus cremoris]MCT0486833.1 hypothetical protein [Lactococcus cremoris]
MTQYSFPWNDVHGDRLYDADDFMRFFAAFLKTGVVMSFKDGLRVRSTKNGMNIQVGSGSAVIDGGSYLNDKAIGIQVNVASSIQERMDSVVLRMDKNARTTQLFYKPGDTTVARNDTTYELQLAKISVKNNATQITDADITDMRSDFTVCGWSTPFDNINVDGIVDQYKEIFEQKDLEFQAWFKNLKKQLDDNQASNLQNQIDNLGNEKANDHEVVHKTGDESIAGNKTFTGDMTVKNISASGSLTSKIVSTKMESPAIKHTFVRTGNMVTLTTETKSGIAQTTAYDIPSGYRPFNDGTNPIYEQVLSGGKSATIRSSNATWQPRVSAILDAGLFGTVSWPTKDNFPG